MSDVLNTFRQQNPAYRPHSVNALQYDDRPLASDGSRHLYVTSCCWMSDVALTSRSWSTGWQKPSGAAQGDQEGTLSAEKQAGEWRIEPAELFRVYPPGTVSSSNDHAPDTAGLQMEITLLRERIDDLVEDRDRWRVQAEHVTRLLTDQRPAAQSDTGPEPRRRRKWWPW